MNMFEAFTSFTSLNEEAFNLNDDGIKAADELVMDDDFEDVVDILDPNAKDEDDLEDSYVGKGILDCNVCHSLIYKDMADIVEEDGVYNAGEECPYCAATDGFTAIGKVAPFNDDAAIEDAEEAPGVDDVDLEVDLDDIDDIEVEDHEEDEKIEESLITEDTVDSELNEDFNNVNIASEDESITISNKEGGGIIIETSPASESEPLPAEEDEMIVPLEAKDEVQIDTDTDVDMELPEETPDEILDTPDEEEPVEESMVVEKKKKVQKPFVKKDAGDLSRLNALLGESDDIKCKKCKDAPEEEYFDVEEIDECTLDPMIEKCLKDKRSYVESYETTAIKEVSDTSVIVEGVVKTNNGKKHKISFVAEAIDEQHPGNFKMSLMTESFKSGKMSFILNGKVDANKLYTESVILND